MEHNQNILEHSCNLASTSEGPMRLILRFEVAVRPVLVQAGSVRAHRAYSVIGDDRTPDGKFLVREVSHGTHGNTGGRISPGKADKSRKRVELHESVGSGYSAHSFFAAFMSPCVPSVQRILPNMLLAIGLLLETIL